MTRSWHEDLLMTGFGGWGPQTPRSASCSRGTEWRPRRTTIPRRLKMFPLFHNNWYGMPDAQFMSAQTGPWKSETCAISPWVCAAAERLGCRLKCFNSHLTRCQKPSEITERVGNMTGGRLSQKQGLDNSFTSQSFLLMWQYSWFKPWLHQTFAF